MTVIFLDFDGVLHPVFPKEHLTWENANFSKRYLVWQVLRACHDIEVVISSSWRFDFLERDLHKLARLVTKGGGEDLVDRFIGMTPDFRKRNVNREDECLAWIEANRPKSQWLAVDDYGLGFPTTRVEHLYLVHEDGLVDEDVPKIIELLRGRAA